MLDFKLLPDCVSSQPTRAASRRAKVFGFGRPRPMCREAKAKLAFMLRALRGSRALSRAHFDVAEKLLFQFHNSASGRCFPSLDALARSARCSVKTVQRAICALEALKVLSWVHRLEWRSVEAPGLGSVRVPRRSSNGYQFHLPAGLSLGLTSYVRCDLGAGDGALGSPRATVASVISRPGVAVPALSPVAPVRAAARDLLSPLDAALARLGAALSGAPL